MVLEHGVHSKYDQSMSIETNEDLQSMEPICRQLFEERFGKRCYFVESSLLSRIVTVRGFIATNFWRFLEFVFQ